MTHPVALTPPISGAAAVKLYPGFGILGVDIPTTGDNGGSVVLNDDIEPTGEYSWRVVTPPAEGVLTIYPDLSSLHTGAPDGVWPWVYRLYKFGVDQGTATVYSRFGTAVNLAAVGVSVASGNATGLVSVPLSAAGIALAGGGAAAQATVRISAAGLAAAAGAAGLSAAVLLAGAGAAQAAGNAPLAARLSALAAGSAQASGTAILSGGAPGTLSASGAAVASGAALLAISIQLHASGAAQASGSAGGVASSPGAISASGGAQAGGSALPVVTANISAAGFVQAMGHGYLAVQVNLSALGGASSSGSARLVQPGTGMTVDQKFLIVAAARRYTISAASRNYTNPAVHIMILSSKDPAERITVTFDFGALATAISNPVVTCTVVAGRLSSVAEAMRSGNPEVSGTKVMQRIIGGVSGNTYRLRCEVDDEDGERWVLSDLLTVQA